MTDVASESLDAEAGPGANAQAYSVSELAFALKRTIEDAYGFVRLRGELSKVTFHGNGHVYLDLKDERASISGVIWKGTVRSLAVRPQTGMEVIVTGKVTTYPGRSQYQIIIETMEPAGVGALLAQLERLKAKLAAEGLFAAERKKPLPAMPMVVGVITSPTGAVIRDILHRIADRWPCRVIVWPVVVQGDQAAAQVRAAIEGFDALTAGGPIPRPDIVIVARGGGSVEDLWPFNDEALARAAAASAIPLISAVGHETDTTLIDFVSDRRAPTPTAAAELATPVYADLAAAIADYQRRLAQCGGQVVEVRRTRLSAAARGLPRPDDLLAIATQRLDIASGRLAAALQRNVSSHAHDHARIAARLSPGLLQRQAQAGAERLASLAERHRAGLERNVAVHARDHVQVARRLQRSLVDRAIQVGDERLGAAVPRLGAAVWRRLERDAERLATLEKLRLALNPLAPLKPGLARVHHAKGGLVLGKANLSAGEAVRLEFADGDVGAVVEGSVPPGPRPRPAKTAPEQGDLF